MNSICSLVQFGQQTLTGNGGTPVSAQVQCLQLIRDIPLCLLALFCYFLCDLEEIGYYVLCSLLYSFSGTSLNFIISHVSGGRN